MVNAYTEFLRVEQELSLYGYLRRTRGEEEEEGSEREEERDRKEESGAGAGWLSVSRETLFSTSIYAHVL